VEPVTLAGVSSYRRPHPDDFPFPREHAHCPLGLDSRHDAVHAQNAPALAVLGTFFQNDNAGLEPTTDAERARLKRVSEDFADQLRGSGRYRILPLTDAIRSKVTAGQQPGECGGCETDYGRALGADLIAWLRVQKVSNLILNMNVYIADVKTGRLLLVKSVDLRGNTDDSWSRSLAYLVKNSVLPADIKPAS